MKVYIKIFFLLFFLTLLSCDTDNSRCIKSLGEITSSSKSLNPFDKLVIKSDFLVNIAHSDHYGIDIKAGKNLIPYINFEIKDNCLTLENKNLCDFLRKRIKPIITITCPSLKEIVIEEACDLRTQDTLFFDTLLVNNWAGIFTCDLLLKGHSLYFRSHASTGDFNLSGICDYSYVYNKGNAYFFARDLRTKTAHVVQRSFGKMEINATDNLFIEDIEYGKLYLFSHECPVIDYNNKYYGNQFANYACP